MGGQAELSGPDLAQGLDVTAVPDGGMVQGQAHGEAVLVARQGDRVFAVGAHCTHYGAPLVDGIVVDGTVRCPWHHACFGLEDGELRRPPALTPLACYQVELRGGRLFVGARRPPAPRPRRSGSGLPGRIVIVGAGAAGSMAAETLRREGYPGEVVLLGGDGADPVDRPNLSKDYLAGTAPEEWIPLHGDDFWAEQGIELRRGRRAVRLDPAGRRLALDDGSEVAWDALLLATGAEPIRLSIPGAALPHVFTLRSLADSRALIAAAAGARRAVVIGASFIGLEAAASLRARGVEVAVVAPEAQPLERAMGAEVGAFVRALHEAHGVRFHLGRRPAAIEPRHVTLDDGARLDADLVVMGVGVRPATALAEEAGLPVDRGVLVDERLQAGAPGIFVAGDPARYPDPRTGERVRVEHWVVAQRQGQTAARNLLGARERYDAVPFFWSAHYDVSIRHVGHAERWDEVRIDGSLEARDARVDYRRGGRTLAVATVGRDRAALAAELELEREHPDPARRG